MKLLTPKQTQAVNGGSTTTTTCTKTERRVCNAKETRCVTVSVEVCTEKKN